MLLMHVQMFYNIIDENIKIYNLSTSFVDVQVVI